MDNQYPVKMPGVDMDKFEQKIRESLASTSNLPALTEEAEEVHRVEFINWKAYTVCNVMIHGVWRTCSFPASTSVIEFLMDGMINKCIHWPQGRAYTNHDGE